jgi:tRNA modification GTPase
VVASIFRAPHSFTGEDTIEISCHGSSYIQQQIMQALIDAGARTALAGEFTQRAFLSGKMDLSQAEAVADLIASTSAATHKLAMSQMRGQFSNELASLRLELLNLTSLVELELDFSEEEVEFADRTQLRELADHVHTLISRLVDSFSVGNAIKNGIPVALVGETNAGKSTLLNVLLREERAIVSDIHGTTRDVIEDTINLGGLTFRFIDTAGIRDTADTIESLGIERTFRKLEQASIVLWLIDSTHSAADIANQAPRVLEHLGADQKVILVFNKLDAIPPDHRASLEQLLPQFDRIFISARDGVNTAALEQLLIRAAALPQISASDVIVTNARHYEALVRALAAIDRVRDGLQSHISGDFLAQDIRECIHFLGEITGGSITTDEVLGSIFERFCIGK